jgi:hypothetical protein
MTIEQKKELELKGQLALQAMRRGVRKAFLNGEAYDPDGKGKAFWEAQDAAEKAAAEKKSA